MAGDNTAAKHVLGEVAVRVADFLTAGLGAAQGDDGVGGASRLGLAACMAGVALTGIAGCGQPGHASGPARGASSASADPGIEVYANCESPSSEPAAFRVTCGDAGWTLTGLAWISWTSTSATAIGVLVYNDCTPSCVNGHFHRVPGTKIVLTDPRPSAGGQLVFTRLTETPWLPGYTTGPMHGQPFPLPTWPI
jgi:hypothetical protein